MKILLTGSSGFIGSHLVERLHDDGIELCILPHHMLFAEELPKIINEFQPTVIIHMAAYGNLASQTDDNKIIKANYLALWSLLAASKDVDYEAFVNFSSSSVLLPVDTFYSATKAGGERLISAFANKYKKNVFSVQPFTVIGVGEPEEHLIPTLIRSCLYGEKMRFVGGPVHDFIGVGDFISALRCVIENYYIKGVVEIGTGISTSNEEILNIVEKLTGKKANITRVDNMRSYDTTDWKADPTIIQSLGWKQKESIEQVIEKMIKHERKNPRTLKKT